jgi:hypothetical protein
VLRAEFIFMNVMKSSKTNAYCLIFLRVPM